MIYLNLEAYDSNKTDLYDWLVLFDTEDEKTKIIEEELNTLITYINLKTVKIGRIIVKQTPNTLFRLGISSRTFSLVFFKNNIQDDNGEIKAR